MSNPLSKPLTKKEHQKLNSMLSRFSHEKAMSLEEVDGFFAALHCSPNLVPLDDYLSEVWGDETGEEEPFNTQEELNEFLTLLMRYWNGVGYRFEDEVFLPYLVVDEETKQPKGNEWATGFLRGMYVSGGFNELIENEEQGGSFVPIFALAHEHDDNPELKSFKENLTPEKREELIVYLCASVTFIYRYFAPQRKAYAKQEKERHTLKNRSNKTGRNDPCYCGSGIKYKKCCLPKTIH